MLKPDKHHLIRAKGEIAMSVVAVEAELESDPLDTHTNFSLAYALAMMDAHELKWLALAHTQAWQRHDLEQEVFCLNRIHSIRGTRDCPRARKRSVLDDDYQRDYDEEEEGSMR